MKRNRIIATLSLTALLLTNTLFAHATTVDSVTDADSITYLEAVTTVVSLEIMNLDEDGDFDPEAFVTRGEMAQIITILLNGGADPVFLSDYIPAFTDIEEHWAGGYITYCANLGIVSGLGDGTFDPDRTISRMEAAKMLLCALGYDAEVEGMVGAGWAVSSDVYATKAGVYTEFVDEIPQDTLTREQVAFLVSNTLQSQCVTYGTNEGGLLMTVEMGTMMEQYFS